MVLGRPPDDETRGTDDGKAPWPASVATLYAQDARAARQGSVIRRSANVKTRYAGDKIICPECHERKTRHPTGICNNCREREVVIDPLLERYEAQLYVPYPAEFGKVPTPCKERNEFLKPNASQSVREACWSCDHYEWCLEWGTVNDEEGIWGGLSRPERKRVREGRAELAQSRFVLVA
jgi:hypothetical protein